VKFFGDAVLAEFPSTEMAVRAAAALSKQYAEESARTGRAHDLRIGVHVGDVAVDADGDLYGDSVNAAARIEAAVDPGQVVVSEDVWRQIRGREGFRFDWLGRRDFKGVGSIDLYGVTLEERPTTSSVSDAEKAGQQPEKRKEKIRSIAVLPFADLSAERDQEHFSDGIAEEILNALSKVGSLHVPARTSCFAFREANLDAREIGKRLGVETLLDGSIRKAGKRVRINVQLIDVSNGYQLRSRNRRYLCNSGRNRAKRSRVDRQKAGLCNVVRKLVGLRENLFLCAGSWCELVQLHLNYPNSSPRLSCAQPTRTCFIARPDSVD